MKKIMCIVLVSIFLFCGSIIAQEKKQDVVKKPTKQELQAFKRYLETQRKNLIDEVNTRIRVINMQIIAIQNELDAINKNKTSVKAKTNKEKKKIKVEDER